MIRYISILNPFAMFDDKHDFCRIFPIVIGLLAGLCSARAEEYSLDVVVGGRAFPPGGTTVSGPLTLSTTGSVIIPDGSQVSFKAGSSITLSPGFTVQAGGLFRAYLEEIDSDGDGVPDLVEISLGLDPVDANDVQELTRLVLGSSNRTKLWSMGPPVWWLDRGVVNHSLVADDYAAVNMGQLKNMAKQAYETFKIVGLVSEGVDDQPPLAVLWASPKISADDYVAVNIGQVKAVAAPFYQLLYERGYLEQLPAWLSSPSPDVDNYAMANIGQVKQLFSFNLSSSGVAATGGDYVNMLEGVPIEAWRAVYQASSSTAGIGTAVDQWLDERGHVPLFPEADTPEARPLWILAEGGQRAVALNGSVNSDYLKSEALPFGQSIADAFTILFLVRPTGSDQAMPAFEISVGEPAALRIAADETNIGKLKVSGLGGDVLDNCPPGSFMMNQWQYWAFVFDEGTGYLYKNGELLATKANLASPPYWSDLRVGRNSSVWLADMAVVAQSLTPAQVAAYGEVLRTRYAGGLLAAENPIAGPGVQSKQLSLPSETTSRINGLSVGITITTPTEGASL